jgi:hypothetical protein
MIPISSLEGLCGKSIFWGWHDAAQVGKVLSVMLLFRVIIAGD